jgi:hypothetical protein
MAISTDKVPQDNDLAEMGEVIPDSELADVEEAEEDPESIMELVEEDEDRRWGGFWRKWKKVCRKVRRCRRYGKRLRCRAARKCRWVKKIRSSKKGYKFMCRRKRVCRRGKGCRWGRRTCKWVKRPSGNKCRRVRTCRRARCFLRKRVYKGKTRFSRKCLRGRCWTRRVCKKPAMKMSYAWKACDASKGGLVSKKELKMCIPKLFKALAKCVIRKSVWLHKKLYKKSKGGLNQKQFTRLMRHARWNAMRCMNKGLRRK